MFLLEYGRHQLINCGVKGRQQMATGCRYTGITVLHFFSKKHCPNAGSSLFHRYFRTKQPLLDNNFPRITSSPRLDFPICASAHGGLKHREILLSELSTRFCIRIVIAYNGFFISTIHVFIIKPIIFNASHIMIVFKSHIP